MMHKFLNQLTNPRIVTALALIALSGSASAATTLITGNLLIDGILSTIIYGAIGIAMAALGFVMVDFMMPGNLRDQIAEHENVALGVLTGFTVLGVCIIIAAVLVG